MSTNWRARYEAHLQSDRWKETKAAAIRRAHHHCQMPTCSLLYLRSLTHAELQVELDEWLPPNAYRLEVHHLTYKRLGHEHPDDLIVLCPGCHAKAHDHEPAYRSFTTSMQDAVGQALISLANDFCNDGAA